MSADTPSTSDGTFLARRDNFLGLPSERRGGSLTFSALRAELGEDNANALVVKIGSLVQSHHLDRLGLSDHAVVDRVLQSLSPDERRTMAEGGIVPRVQEIIQAEANTAKLQQKQAPTNAYAADAPAQKEGNVFLPKRLTQAMRGDGNAISGQTPNDGDLRSITSANYGKTGLAATGLSYDAFSAMRSEGFNLAQIKAAVGANRSLGLDANDNPAATARLQRDTPWAVPHLQQRRSELQGIRGLRQQADKAEREGRSGEAERLRKKADEEQKKHDEEHGRDRARISKEHPERLPDYDNRYDRIHDNVMKGLSSGNELEDKATLTTIENYRRNPNNADARRDYAELNKKAGADPRKQKAMAAADRDARQLHQEEVAETKKNEVKSVVADRKDAVADKKDAIADNKDAKATGAVAATESKTAKAVALLDDDDPPAKAPEKPSTTPARPQPSKPTPKAKTKLASTAPAPGA